MEITINDVGKYRKTVKMFAPAEEIQQEYKKKLQELQANIHLKGFRPGKVPFSYLESKYGKNVLEEMQYTFLQKALQSAMQEKKFRPLGEPRFQLGSFEIKKDQEFKLEFTLDIQPEFEVPDYKSLQVIKANTDATPEDMDMMIEELRTRRGEMVSVENAVSQENDLLIGDLEIKSENEVLLSQKNAKIYAKDTSVKNIPLEKALLIGRKQGDVCQTNVVLPQEFEVEKGRGKNAEFVFQVSEVKRLQLPAFNDAFVKEMGFETLEACKKALEEQIKHEKTNYSDQQTEHFLLHQLIEETKMELPEEFIKEKIEAMKTRQKASSEAKEEPKEEPKEESEEEKKKKEEDLRNKIIWELKEYLIMEKIAEKEKIEVTEDEVDDFIQAIASLYKKWPTEIKKQYEESGRIEELRYSAKIAKVLQFLKENATVVDADSKEKKNIVCEH